MPFLNYLSERKIMRLSVIRYNREEGVEFVSALRKRVNDHFVDNKISKFGNLNMVLKSIFIISLYFVPFVVIISGVVSSFWMLMLLWGVMGFGMCGIGVSIIHDANHGSFSKYNMVNKVMGYMLNVVGAYHVTWKIQHNVLHHSSTNVHQYDEDLDNQLMRFSPEQERKSINKYQAYFAPFLYGLLSIYKMFSKDFEQIFRYNKMKLLTSQGKTFRSALIDSLVNKVVYLTFTLVLPIVLLPLPWWYSLLGFLLMHFICGINLALIFQSAHVIEKTDFYTADETGSVENCWAIHQMNTTANFAKNARIFSWLIGGLNYQVEHHLFPNICHVHYRDISNIVKNTAKEYGVAYNEYPTFLDAIVSHFKLLNSLGKA
ncbi:MAG: acyl-CoA desaturase [Reichenbachiella sp.]